MRTSLATMFGLMLAITAIESFARCSFEAEQAGASPMRLGALDAQAASQPDAPRSILVSQLAATDAHLSRDASGIKAGAIVLGELLIRWNRGVGTPTQAKNVISAAVDREGFVGGVVIPLMAISELSASMRRSDVAFVAVSAIAEVNPVLATTLCMQLDILSYKPLGLSGDEGTVTGAVFGRLNALPPLHRGPAPSGAVSQQPSMTDLLTGAGSAWKQQAASSGTSAIGRSDVACRDRDSACAAAADEQTVWSAGKYYMDNAVKNIFKDANPRPGEQGLPPINSIVQTVLDSWDHQEDERNKVYQDCMAKCPSDSDDKRPKEIDKAKDSPKPKVESTPGGTKEGENKSKKTGAGKAAQVDAKLAVASLGANGAPPTVGTSPTIEPSDPRCSLDPPPAGCVSEPDNSRWNRILACAQMSVSNQNDCRRPDPISRPRARTTANRPALNGREDRLGRLALEANRLDPATLNLKAMTPTQLAAMKHLANRPEFFDKLSPSLQEVFRKTK